MTDRRRGFTLVELVLALAILGFALTYLVFLRMDAVRKVTTVVEEREVRRLVQETLEQKMAEFLSNELEEIAGEFPDRPGWYWEWLDPLDPLNVIQEGEEYLLACTVRITYPDPDEPELEERTAEMTTWILPTEEQLAFILEWQEAMYEEDAFGPDPYEY
jgi:prepilin-type N-terminal cleavage/methylation domain-containing protein